MKTNKRQRRTFIMTKRPRRYNNCYICTQDKRGFPGGSDGKESACNAGDPGSIPGLGRSPGEGNGNPLLQYSCLENLMDRSLVAYSPWNHKELDTTEWLTLSLSPEIVSNKKVQIIISNITVGLLYLNAINRSSRKKINKETLALNDIKPDGLNIFGTV